MLGEDEIKEMQEEVRAMEVEIAAKKKALRDAKYAGLRAAMQARQEADAAVRQELKDLGLQTNPFALSMYSHWRI